MNNASVIPANVETALWESTRERYIDWAARWGESSGIKTELLWQGFSLWWCSNLVQKDAEVNKAWYEKLHARLNGVLPYAIPQPKTAKQFFLFAKLFIADSLKWALVKALFHRQKIPGEQIIWFHSLASNIRHEDDVACDRMYSKAHLLDKAYGAKSGYAISLTPGLKDLLAPFRFKRKIQPLLLDIQRDVLVLNGFLRFRDIVKVHVSLFAKWNKFRKLARNNDFKEGFQIDGIRCDDILIDELERSFFGPFQWSLLSAISFQKWLEKAARPQLIVTYAETVALLRPIYFFSKSVNSKHQFMSIQHANFIKNKLFLYHRASEFSQDGKWDGVHFSPMPDYYFVQGQHFKSALEQYYPASRTKIIGCLKYDQFTSVLASRNQYAEECRSKLGGDPAQKIMLITPSVNDLRDILKVFSGATLPASWRAIISPHPFLSLDGYRKIIDEMNITFTLEFSPGLPTYKLLTVADLVICGYSAVAFEAAFFGVRSVRLFDNSTCPQFDDEPEIPSFSRKEDFWRWFNDNNQSPKTQLLIGSETDRLVTDYFYKIDGKSANRLWESIMPIAQTVS